jgi:hypothetical protein
MITACVIKPKPMVMMFSMSRRTTALKNNKISPAHMNMTMSKFGTVSLSPVSKARSVGIVAQCMTTTANQPRVSALTLGKCCSNQALTEFNKASNLIIMFRFFPHKKCAFQFYLPVVCPTVVLHSLHENTRRFSCWANGILQAGPFLLLLRLLASVLGVWV